MAYLPPTDTHAARSTCTARTEPLHAAAGDDGDGVGDGPDGAPAPGRRRAPDAAGAATVRCAAATTVTSLARAEDGEPPGAGTLVWPVIGTADRVTVTVG